MSVKQRRREGCPHAVDELRSYVSCNLVDLRQHYSYSLGQRKKTQILQCLSKVISKSSHEVSTRPPGVENDNYSISQTVFPERNRMEGLVVSQIRERIALISNPRNRIEPVGSFEQNPHLTMQRHPFAYLSCLF